MVPLRHHSAARAAALHARSTYWPDRPPRHNMRWRDTDISFASRRQHVGHVDAARSSRCVYLFFDLAGAESVNRAVCGRHAHQWWLVRTAPGREQPTRPRPAHKSHQYVKFVGFYCCSIFGWISRPGCLRRPACAARSTMLLSARL